MERKTIMNNKSRTELMDYTKIPDGIIGEFENGTALANALREIQKQDIIVLPKLEEKESVQIIKTYGQDETWTQKYIGVLEYDGKTIYIGSRFDDKGKNFTNYILSKALGIKSVLFEKNTPKVDYGLAMEKLLAIVFVNQIEMAYKKGLFRTYRTYERNNAKVKGKIDIARHVRLNPLFNGQIAYAYREYTVDNDVNRIILTAYCMLEKKYKSWMNDLTKPRRNVKDCIAQLKNIMQPISREEVRVLLKKANKKITHSVYKDWEKVRKTAILLLRHMGIHIASENNSTICGVLLDMNYIWEQYLENVLRENTEKTLKTQEETKILFSKNNEAKRTIKPDFRFTNNDNKKSILILDAKYKRKWQDAFIQKEGTWKGVREDVFQILAYMYTFKCDRAGVVCPVVCDKEKTDWKEKKYTIDEYKKENNNNEQNCPTFYIVPFYIPSEIQDNDSGYGEKMKKAEEEFRESVNKILEE